MDTGVRAAAVTFVDAFERVFHSDWPHTRAQLGMGPDDEKAEEEIARRFGEEPAPQVGRATLLAPRSVDLEIQNWGSYELLLEAYAELCKTLGREPVR